MSELTQANNFNECLEKLGMPLTEEQKSVAAAYLGTFEDLANKQIKEMREALETLISEHTKLLNQLNDDLKFKICPTDLDEPDYYDFQTVYEATKALKKARGES